ncbi:uncharacterized protein LOC117783994 [Drosophila innubila]|uniref:uncharacterized protein LOC117783994 n=1 Tax=Drosophila innubila TaxID=198719 RepID=UPI00148C7D9A|nr:uncharacterized protein LOC117783994 [Drosophila innubila]
MLKDSYIPAIWPDASNQCLFKVNTRDPRLNLGPVSFISPFELESDLDMCLSLNLNCPTSSNEFNLDFSLPTNPLSDFVAPTNKLNVLPEKIDYSELLSLQTSIDSSPMEQSFAEFCKSVEDDQSNSRLPLMPEAEQISDNIEKILLPDDIEEPKIQRNVGLLSGFIQNGFHWTQLIKKLIVDDNSKRIGPREYLKSSLLMNLFKVIMSDSDLPGILSVNPKSTKLPAPTYNEFAGICQGLAEFSLIPANTNEETHSENVEPFYERVAKEHVSEQVDKDADIKNYLIVKEEDGQKSVKEERSEKSREYNEHVTADKKLGHSKEKSLKSFHDIIDANEVKKTGVQIFRKPTKLFVFDSLKEWKIKGEGQIEIWEMDGSDSEIYYMLLWDKSSKELLIHMRLDSKWSIDYLANCTNSCYWSHYNYANYPKGVRQRLACRFRDSEVAAQFFGIVNKCVENSRLH